MERSAGMENMKTLERNIGPVVNAYLQTRGELITLWQDPEVGVLLASKPDIKVLASTVCKLIQEDFPGAEVHPCAVVDPDSGLKYLSVGVGHTFGGEDAWSRTKAFFDKLPEGVNDGGLVTVSVFKRK